MFVFGSLVYVKQSSFGGAVSWETRIPFDANDHNIELAWSGRNGNENGPVSGEGH